jgi:addiction module HigA family antidote
MHHAHPNIHPGEILREEFLKPTGVDVETLARDLKLPQDRLDEIVQGRGKMCVDIALRLSYYFGTSERFWLEMQMTYDLEHARRRPSSIQSEVTPRQVA